MKKFKEFYKGKECVVTGGKGFIGGALANRLIELDANVSTCDIKNNQDIREKSRVESELYGAECVFHLAALTEVADSYKRPYDYYTTNVVGTLNILECCREFKVERLVVASTDKVYGETAMLPYNETMYLTPSPDPYSNSKRLMDNLCQDYSRTYDLPIRILRSCNTYGPGQRNKTTLIVNTIRSYLDGKLPVIHSSSVRTNREWLYIDDAIDAYLLAGMAEIEKDKIVWNVGSYIVSTPEHIVTAIAKKLNVKPEYEIVDDGIKRVRDHMLNSLRYFKVMGETNVEWIGQVVLDAGLDKTVEWYKQIWNKQ